MLRLMHDQALSIALIGIFGIGAQWIAWRTGWPAIALMLAAGVISGPVLHLINPEHVFGELLEPMVSVAVALILFEGGLSLNFRDLRRVRWHRRVFFLFWALLRVVVDSGTRGAIHLSTEHYGRVATSFAQVMSLRIVPNSPVVDEVLFGGSSPSPFRRGRLLPRWLLLNREVDRIAVQQDGDEEAAKIQREGAYSVPETIPASGSLVPAVDEDKSADEEERRSHSVDGSSDTGRSRSGTGSRTHEHVPPLPKNRHRRWPRRSPPPKPTVAGSLDSSRQRRSKRVTSRSMLFRTECLIR